MMVEDGMDYPFIFLLEFFITVATVISNSNTVTQDTFSLRSSTGQLSAPELSRRTKRPRKVKRLRQEVVAPETLPARWSKWRRKKTSSTTSFTCSGSALGAESRSTPKIYLV